MTERFVRRVDTLDSLTDDQLIRAFADTGDYSLIRDRPDLQRRLGVGASSDETSDAFIEDDEKWAREHGYEIFSESPAISVLSQARYLVGLGIPLIPPKNEGGVEAFCDTCVKHLQELFLQPDSRRTDELECLKEVLYFSFLKWPDSTTRYFVNKMHGREDGQYFIFDAYEQLIEKADRDAEGVELGMFRGVGVEQWAEMNRRAIKAAVSGLKDYLGMAERNPASRYLMTVRVKALLSDMHLRGTEDWRPFRISDDTWAIFTWNKERIKLATETQMVEWSGDRKILARLGRGATIDAEGDVRDLLLNAGSELEERLEPGEKADPWLVSRLKSCVRGSTRRVLTNDFLFDFSQFGSIRELIYFVDYVRDVTIEEQHIVRSLIKSYGRDFLRSFLAVAAAKDVRDEIVDLAQTSEQARARAVFEAFGRFADVVRDVEHYAQKNLGVRGPDEISMFAHEFLKKGRDLLGRAHEYKDDPRKLAALIERYSAEGQLLMSTYQFLKSGNRVKTLSEVKGVVNDTVSSRAEGFDAFITKCRALYKQNGATDALIEKFEQKARTPGAVIHRVMFKDTLISFMLQYPEGEGRVEFGALNARDELSETSVGMNLFADVLAQVLGQGKEVEFDALPDRYRQYEKILPRKLRSVPMQFATLRAYDDEDDDNRLTFRARISMVKDSAE